MSGYDLTLADVADALRYVLPHDRDVWIRIGMAIKAEFGEAGFETWDEWSQGADNYQASAARASWRSFGAGGITIGTLIHTAREGGWSPPKQELSEEEQRRRQAEHEARRKARAAEMAAEAERERAWQARIGAFCQELWDGVLAKTSSRAPYLGRKQVGAHGVRFARHGAVLVVDDSDDSCRVITGADTIRAWFASEEKDQPWISFRYLKAGTVVVPMRDVDGVLWGLQFIFPEGGKTFLKHGRKSGCFHLLGKVDGSQPLAFAEGYATAASIHEATGWPVVVAFDAGNLETVAVALRDRYPDLHFIICGDDDHEHEGNAGRAAARRAAGRTGGITAFPVFRDPAGRTDWNDLHVEQGLEAVAGQLLAAAVNAPQAYADENPPAEPDPGGEVASEDATQNGEQSAEGASTPGSGSAAGSGGGGGRRGATGGPPSDRPWLDYLNRNGGGALKATLHNIITILENHPGWVGVFRLDAFANQIYRATTPYGAEPGPITDVDGGEIAAWLGDPRNGYGISVSSAMALEAVEVVATRRQFHPVLDYLDSLQWDGIERLPWLLSDYFGAKHNEYTAAVGKNWLVSAVARVRKPGCKVDTMVILEGGQGLGKSTAVRTLCGPEWFAEMLESPQNKDFYQVLTGRWIIEIPELQAFNKADRNKIKAAISAQEDTYRPSYGRYARQFPRQNIFVGTTNDDTYLKDETGARRFMPVRCGPIELESLLLVRDQLWAEADARFKRGESWWEYPESAQWEQDARYDADAWEDPIIQWLDGHCDVDCYRQQPRHITRDKPVEETTVAEVMEYALGIEIAKHSRPDQMRVGAILRRLGWRRCQKTHQGRVRYVYTRPETGRVAA